MWREIKQLAGKKPLVATMGDVAASGGYYMAMASPSVVAHPLTITGSIGVITGKFNLEELFAKVRGPAYLWLVVPVAPR
jgi:protease IV